MLERRRGDSDSAPSDRAHSAWPSVSVIIPTRNRPEQLARAVESVLRSTYEGEIELLVVFDQSEPAPVPNANRPGRLVRVLTNDRRPGLAGARNTGLLAARGDLIAFCDDDDEWLADKLRLQVEAMHKHPDAEVATTGVQLLYRGKVHERVPVRARVTLTELVRSRHVELHPSTFLAKRDAVLQGIGLIDEALPGSYGEDYEWLLRAAERGPILAVQRPLVRVDWGGSSWFSERWSNVIEAIAYLIDRHPSLRSDRRGLARLYGRTAFAHAALGHRRTAAMWAASALRLNAFEPRGYISLAVAASILSARTAIALARRLGRGI